MIRPITIENLSLKSMGLINSLSTNKTRYVKIYPFPHDKILDQSKFKAFVDDKLNVTKMIISFFDTVENMVGKGEIALYKQFLLFPQCFQKASFPDPSKGVIVWEWVKSICR